MKFSYDVLILESHLDTFGHVNNAAYLTLFEQARWEVITKRGFGLEEVRAREIGPTILGVTLKFAHEIRLREKIQITTEVSGRKNKIFTLTQVMVKSNGEAACTAEFTMGLFDLKARRLIEPTPEWLSAIGIV